MMVWYVLCILITPSTNFWWQGEPEQTIGALLGGFLFFLSQIKHSIAYANIMSAQIWTKNEINNE